MLSVSIRSAVFAVLACVGSLGATTTYTQSVTSVTSVTITGATHGLGCSNFGVRVYDNTGVRRNDLISSAPINSSNYNVTVNFSSAFTGSVKLQGCFNAYTTASTDFQVLVSGDGTTAYLCASCTDAAPAVRNSGGYNYASVGEFTLTSTNDGQAGTLYVWLDPATGRAGWGTTTSGAATSPSTGSTLTHSVTGYPSGVLQLARVSYGPIIGCLSGQFCTVTDDRPW